MTGKRFGRGTSFSFSPRIEDLDWLNKAYDDLVGTEKVTNAEFMRRLFAQAQPVDVPEELQRLREQNQQLNERIEQFKLKADNEVQRRDQRIVDLDQEISRLNQRLNDAAADTAGNTEILDENTRLKDQVRQLQEINTGLHEQIASSDQAQNLDPRKAILVEMTPFEAHLIYATTEKESKRLGKDVQPGVLLKQMLLSYYLKGAHDHFPKYFSKGDLRRIAEHYEMEQKQEDQQEQHQEEQQ